MDNIDSTDLILQNELSPALVEATKGLTPAQRKYVLYQINFGEVVGERAPTKTELAKMIGVSRQHLHRLEHDAELTTIINRFCDNTLLRLRPLADARLAHLVEAGSVKALEMYYRQLNILNGVDKQQNMLNNLNQINIRIEKFTKDESPVIDIKHKDDSADG